MSQAILTFGPRAIVSFVAFPILLVETAFANKFESRRYQLAWCTIRPWPSRFELPCQKVINNWNKCSIVPIETIESEPRFKVHLQRHSKRQLLRDCSEKEE